MLCDLWWQSSSCLLEPSGQTTRYLGDLQLDFMVFSLTLKSSHRWPFWIEVVVVGVWYFPLVPFSWWTSLCKAAISCGRGERQLQYQERKIFDVSIAFAFVFTIVNNMLQILSQGNSGLGHMLLWVHTHPAYMCVHLFVRKSKHAFT